MFTIVSRGNYKCHTHTHIHTYTVAIAACVTRQHSERVRAPSDKYRHRNGPRPGEVQLGEIKRASERERAERKNHAASLASFVTSRARVSACVHARGCAQKKFGNLNNFVFVDSSGGGSYISIPTSTGVLR